MTKKVLKIQGMHCSSCAMSIEWELEDLGVKAKCTYASGVLEVEYDQKKIKEEDIYKAIKKAGYCVAS